MISKKYASIGNRREKNLSDVENKTTALNNLLNGLSGDGTFISEDLDAIRGLQFEKINADNISQVAGTTVTVTPANTESGIPELAEPLITLRDKVEKAKITTGPIPAYRGGLGLDARFIPSTDINASNVNSTGSNIFNYNSNQILEPEYWEYGNFTHDLQIDPSFSNPYGGIQWTGYFSPFIFDIAPTIYCETTGLLIIEYDLLESNNWIKIANIYDTTRKVTVATNSTGNVVQLTADQYLNVSVGDKLNTNNSIKITGVSTSSISLSDDVTATGGQDLLFTKKIGTDLNRNTMRLPPVEPGKLIKIRISYWYPNNGLPVEKKILNFSYLNSDNLPFSYLYSKTPLAAGNNEFRTFLSKALSPYNNDLGTTGSGGENYKNLLIARTYINNYEPKANTANVVTANSVTLNFTANLTLTTVSGSIDNVKVGNYIVPTSPTGTALPTKLQVKYIYGNIIVLNQPPTATGSRTVNFVDHKGFIGWYFASSSGANVSLTVNNTTDLESNNIIIKNSTDSTFNRILKINTSNTFTTSPNLSLSGTQLIYAYSEKGLTDKSKLNFCSGVFGAVLASNAAVGNSLVVASNSGIDVGQVVQYSGYIPETPPTTVTGISGNTINLSNNILFEILQNSTITFAPAGTDINKEICVIPLDTAPPFLGTADGLSTASRGLKSSDTLTENFTISTDRFVISTNNENITAVPTTFQYDRKIRINNNNYFIIAKTV